MTWRERRIVTILTAIALVLAAALLIVLGIRFRQWRAASESGAAVGADGTGTAADPAAYTALTYENGSTTLSFARDEAGQWAWTADGDFPLGGGASCGAYRKRHVFGFLVHIYICPP